MREYLAAMPTDKLKSLCQKAHVEFWKWIDIEYYTPSLEATNQVNRWRRITYMMQDELYCEERFKT